MIQTISFRNSKFGHRLFLSVWKPEKKPVAVIVLVHGFGEHCLRYDSYLNFFIESGIACVAFDLFGHGQSEGKRGNIISYQVFLDDVQLMVNEARKQFPQTPVFIYGHSMGGNIAVNYLLKHQTDVEGGIISSPWLTLAKNPNFLLQMIISVFRHLLPNTTVNSGLEIKYISTDASEVEKYKTDPLNHGKISFRLFAEITKHGFMALHQSGKLQVPVLWMHGDEDKITSYRSSQKAASNNSQWIQFIPWKGRYHELHNEINRQEVATTVIEWIKKNVSNG